VHPLWRLHQGLQAFLRGGITSGFEFEQIKAGAEFLDLELGGVGFGADGATGAGGSALSSPQRWFWLITTLIEATNNKTAEQIITFAPFQ